MLAVPAQTLRQNLTGWQHLLPPGALLVSLMKGIELGTGDRMSQVIAEITGAGPDRIAVDLRPEPGAGDRRQAVLRDRGGLRRRGRCRPAAEGLPYRLLPPVHQPDVVGCELGGAVKNVIALAVGIAVGMGLGDNTKAMLITRGLAEIARLGAALGADSAYLRRAGRAWATWSPLAARRCRGTGPSARSSAAAMPLAEVLASTNRVAEGVQSSKSVLQLAREHGVEMPITEVIFGVMHDGLDIGQAVLLLASRIAKPERYGV